MPAVLKPALYVVKDQCLTHTGFSVNQFKGRTVGAFEISAAVCPILVQPEWLVIVLYKNLLIFFQETDVNLWFISKIGGILF